MAEKTKKPTGLSLKRNGTKYTAKWKAPHKDYAAGQVCGWAIVKDKKKATKEKAAYKKHTKELGITKKALKFKVPETDCYPTEGKPKIKAVAFRVRGKKKNEAANAKIKASDWTYTEFPIKPPRKPKRKSVKVEVTNYPSCKASWSVKIKNGDGRPFVRVRYEYKIITDSNTIDGTKVDWTGATTGTSTNPESSINIPVDPEILADGHSHTVWFRIISEGPGGFMKKKKKPDWVYAHHALALSNKPEITSCEFEDGGTTYKNVRVKVNSPRSQERPITSLRLEYLIDNPGEYFPAAPAGSWNEAATVKPKDNTSGFICDIDAHTTINQALWLRVVAIYDDAESIGDSYLVTEAIGKLSKPTINSVSFDTANREVTVNAENTAASDVSVSRLVIKYKDNGEYVNGVDIGVMDSSQETVKYPVSNATGKKIVVYGAIINNDKSSSETREDGVTYYEIQPWTVSPEAYQAGTEINIPQNVRASQTGRTGSVRVSWEWGNTNADGAELSWSENPEAWESTDEPQTYEVRRGVSSWIIAGLTAGATYYIRVRLYEDDETGKIYGGYSEPATINLSTAPERPIVELSDSIIPFESSTIISWSYEATDGAEQTGAYIYEYDDTNDEYTIIATVTDDSQSYELFPAEIDGWSTGEKHLLAVAVVSSQQSPTSDMVPLTVAEPVTAAIRTNLELISETIEDEDDQPDTSSVIVLKQLPLRIWTTGGNGANSVTVAIERAEDYYLDRPDEEREQAFEGDTIYLEEFTGDRTPLEINYEDLMDPFDDTHLYRIVMTVSDGLGQTAEAEGMTVIQNSSNVYVENVTEFEVQWSHQASEPGATVVIDRDYGAAYLTPIAPSDAAQGDVCDIYRLSVDKPVLIYEGATFGQTYVDPYPAIGLYGGHRFVTRSKDGDYTTPDGHLAWYDTGAEQNDIFNVPYNIIDFPGGSAYLTFNASLQGSWDKDFTETKYLGGRVTGDWNPAVSRKTQVSAEAPIAYDAALIPMMRQLADYPGVCHVRTKDGSSYAADVQVADDYNYASGVKTMSYNLTITRVQPEGFDGLTLEEWNAIHRGESE